MFFDKPEVEEDTVSPMMSQTKIDKRHKRMVMRLAIAILDLRC